MGHRLHECRTLDDVVGKSTTGCDGSSGQVWIHATRDCTCLSPRQIRGDDKLDIPVAEDAENHAPKVPLMKTGANFKQFSRGLLLAGFVAAPPIGPVPTCLILFVDQVWLNVLPTLLGDETGKNEDGFDSKLLEGPEVGFDTLCQGEGETTCCGEQGLLSRWILIDGLEIVASVDAEPGIREDGERKRLDVFPSCQIVCSPYELMVCLRMDFSHCRNV